MSLLFLSIATSGLPKGSLSADSRQQPWICRIAASLETEDGKPIEHFACGIRAGDRKIDPQASAKHGITSAYAARSGVDESFALSMVCGLKMKTKADGTVRPDKPGLASNARYVVAWNVEFVKTVIGMSFEKYGEPAKAWLRPGLSFLCLQQACAPWCKIPDESGSGGYASPTRDQACSALLGLPERQLPHSVDENLQREKLLFTWLQSTQTFEHAA